MPLSNPWWESDPQQRYWIEITSREDLGEDLLSPKVGRGGRPTPGYESMVHVRPGDIIFHYWQQPGQDPAIVSYSQAIGPAFTSTITWRPRGKNAAGLRPVRSAAWQIPLGEMIDLEEIVTLSDLRRKSEELRTVADSISAVHGKTTYFPFAWYQDELRAVQAYLTKFPSEILGLFPELQVVDVPLIEDDKTSPRDVKPRIRHGGYIADPEIRKAIELQAMRQAEKFLNDQGYSTRDVSASQPYDIHATRGEEQIAVEVKGSSGVATTVELTIGEVKKARDPSIGSMLVVVDEIEISVTPSGVETNIGRLRFWPEWVPEVAGNRLQAIRFRYLLEPVSEDTRP